MRPQESLGIQDATDMHSLIQRQLKRHFGDEVPVDLKPFLEVIDRAYQDFDADRLMLERSLDLSSRELMLANADLRALIGAFPDLFFRLAQDGRILDCKGGGVQSALAPVEQLIGKRIQDIPDPRAGRAFQEALERLSRTQEPANLEYTLDVKGRLEYFEARLLPVFEGQFMAIIRNITDRKQAEETLLHAQKLESIGVLAGGIAHDFNNLLTAALGNLDISALVLPEGAEAHPYLESVRGTLMKAANLTRQMLAYSGRGRFVVQIHDLNLAVHEIASLLEVTIGKKATLEYDLASQLPLLEADVAQIQQVIMNLVTNASDALQDQGGSIRIRTWAREMDAEAISMLPVQFMHPGLHVALEVSDTGIGMPPEVLARIFEPFFSTKGVGRGLGLSAMVGILRSHGGGLAVESVPGKGTTFILWFPATSLACERAEAATPVQDGPLPAGAVLLVEDEADIRRSTGRLLQEMGLGVFEAQDGREGLDQFLAHEAEISLIILDLMMPRMDGREFLAELRELSPDFPVIVSSGYTEQELPADGRTTAFLQKPYQSSDLRKAVHRALESRFRDADAVSSLSRPIQEA